MPLANYSGILVTAKIHGKNPTTCTLEDSETTGVWLAGSDMLAYLSTGRAEDYPRGRKPKRVFIPFANLEWMVLYEAPQASDGSSGDQNPTT